MSAITPSVSDDTLRTQAASQVDASIKASTDPLYRQQSDLQGRETQAIGQIGGMFDQLQPVVEGEAGAVQSSYDAANQASQSIFEAAQQRMDQLRQQRANEAQTLSQQIGGPVAVNEFTAAVDPDQTALASIAPNSLLHGLANAQAGTQQARAFSERVFPAMRTEQIANARNTFESQIDDLRKQIDSITSQRGTLIDQKLTDLQTAQKDWDLKQAQLKLDQLKADRDWEATKRQLHNDDIRLKISQKQFGLSEAGVTGKYQGRTTVQAAKIAADTKLAARRMNLSVAQYNDLVRHRLVTESQGNQRITNAAQKNAMAIIDKVTGRTNGALNMNKHIELTPAQAHHLMRSNPNIYAVHKKDGIHYYYDKTVHLSPEQAERTYGSGIKDPQGLYDTLIGAGIPRSMALQTVRAKTQISNFTPGQHVQYTRDDLGKIADRSFNELKGIAVQLGYKPSPRAQKNPQKYGFNKTQFIDFIIKRQQ